MGASYTLFTALLLASSFPPVSSDYLKQISYDLDDCFEFPFRYSVWGGTNGCVALDDGTSYSIACDAGGQGGTATFYSSTQSCSGPVNRTGPIPRADFTSTCVKVGEITTAFECKQGAYMSNSTETFVQRAYAESPGNTCPTKELPPSLITVYETGSCRRKIEAPGCCSYQYVCANSSATLTRFKTISEECRGAESAPVGIPIPDGCDDTTAPFLNLSLSGPVTSECFAPPSFSPTVTPTGTRTPSRTSSITPSVAATPTPTPTPTRRSGGGGGGGASSSTTEVDLPLVLGLSISLGFLTAIVVYLYFRTRAPVEVNVPKDSPLPPPQVLLPPPPPAPPSFPPPPPTAAASPPPPPSFQPPSPASRGWSNTTLNPIGRK